MGKLFEKILLTRVVCEVSGRGLLRNEHFGFRLKHSTALQLNREGLRYCMGQWSHLQTNSPYLSLVPSQNHIFLPE